jgi:hypothetical protein
VTFAPDLIEPIIGWRVWRISHRHNETRLASLVYRAEWPVREPLHARCGAPSLGWGLSRRRHEAPSSHCACGLHGARWELLSREIRRDLLGRKPRFVIGEVALWGTVVEGDLGWRAEFAYPQRLYVPLRQRGRPLEEFKLASDLAAYGVAVELFEAPNANDAVRQIEQHSAFATRQ